MERLAAMMKQCFTFLGADTQWLVCGGKGTSLLKKFG